MCPKGVLRVASEATLLEEGDCFFSPETAAGSSDPGSYRSPFCTSSRRGAGLQEMDRLSPPKSVFIGN